MIYLIKYLNYDNDNDIDIYYCTNNIEELDYIKIVKVIPRTAVKLDVNTIIEIDEDTSCEKIRDTQFRTKEISSFKHNYKIVDDFEVYSTDEPLYVNLKKKETIKLTGLISCIGVYIISKQKKGLIGFHYVEKDEPADKYKILDAISLMKMNKMTTENSSLLLYYIPRSNEKLKRKQLDTLDYIIEKLGFNESEIIKGKESSITYGIDINSSHPNISFNYMSDKPSAYTSMRLSKLGLTKPTTKKNKGALIRWTKEKWINLNALKDENIILPCGRKYKGQTEPTVCRPSKKISEKTPKPLAKNLTSKQIQKAIKIKKKGKRISWKDL